LQYGAIRFARHKKRILARFSHYAPLNDSFGAIRPLRATSPFDWRDSSQSFGGERNLPSPPTWTRLPSASPDHPVG